MAVRGLVVKHGALDTACAIGVGMTETRGGTMQPEHPRTRFRREHTPCIGYCYTRLLLAY